MGFGAEVKGFIDGYKAGQEYWNDLEDRKYKRAYTAHLSEQTKNIHKPTPEELNDMPGIDGGGGSIPSGSSPAGKIYWDDAPPEAKALLNTIAGKESAGQYDVMYGGGKFTDYRQHPNQPHVITSGPNKGETSTAAGKYQFLESTWNDLVKAHPDLTDFSPANQDKAAWYLAQDDYKRNTGRDLTADLKSGDPKVIANVGKALKGTWTSLPGGIEQGQNEDAFVSSYNGFLKGATTQTAKDDTGGAIPDPNKPDIANTVPPALVADKDKPAAAEKSQQTAAASPTVRGSIIATPPVSQVSGDEAEGEGEGTDYPDEPEMVDDQAAWIDPNKQKLIAGGASPIYDAFTRPVVAAAAGGVIPDPVQSFADGGTPFQIQVQNPVNNPNNPSAVAGVDRYTPTRAYTQPPPAAPASSFVPRRVGQAPAAYTPAVGAGGYQQKWRDLQAKRAAAPAAAPVAAPAPVAPAAPAATPYKRMMNRGPDGKWGMIDIRPKNRNLVAAKGGIIPDPVQSFAEGGMPKEDFTQMSPLQAMLNFFREQMTAPTASQTGSRPQRPFPDRSRFEQPDAVERQAAPKGDRPRLAEPDPSRFGPDYGIAKPGSPIARQIDRMNAPQRPPDTAATRVSNAPAQRPLPAPSQHRPPIAMPQPQPQLYRPVQRPIMRPVPAPEQQGPEYLGPEGGPEGTLTNAINPGSTASTHRPPTGPTEPRPQQGPEYLGPEPDASGAGTLTNAINPGPTASTHRPPSPPSVPPAIPEETPPQYLNPEVSAGESMDLGAQGATANPPSALPRASTHRPPSPPVLPDPEARPSTVVETRPEERPSNIVATPFPESTPTSSTEKEPVLPTGEKAPKPVDRPEKPQRERVRIKARPETKKAEAKPVRPAAKKPAEDNDWWRNQWRGGGGASGGRSNFAAGGMVDDEPTGSIPPDEGVLPTRPQAAPDDRMVAGPEQTPQPEQSGLPEVGSGPGTRSAVSIALDGGVKFLQNHFGLGGGNGAVPEPGGEQVAAAGGQRFANGEGATTPQEIQAIDDKVDPNREMSEGDRHMQRYAKTMQWYLMNGRKDEAEAVAAGLMQYGAQRFGQLGSMAGAAYRQYQQSNDPKDLQNTLKFLDRAYEMVPDGSAMDIEIDPDTHKIVAVRHNSDGEVSRDEIDASELPTLIQGAMDKSLYWDQIAQVANPQGHTAKMQQREQNARTQFSQQEQNKRSEESNRTRKEIASGNISQKELDRKSREEIAKANRENQGALQDKRMQAAMDRLHERYPQVNVPKDALIGAEDATTIIKNKDGEYSDEEVQQATKQRDQYVSKIYDALPYKDAQKIIEETLGVSEDQWKYVGSGDAPQKQNGGGGGGGGTVTTGDTPPAKYPDAKRGKNPKTGEIIWYVTRDGRDMQVR